MSISYIKADGETHTLTCNEKPRPEFDMALAALLPVMLAILHQPDTFGEGLKMTGLTVAKKGEQVCLVGIKDVAEANGVWNIASPLRFLDHPKTEGTYTPALTEAHVELIQAVIEEAKEYAMGNRMQGVLLNDVTQEPTTAKVEDPSQTNFLGEGKAGEEQAAPASTTLAAEKPKRTRKAKPKVPAEA